MSEKKEVNDCKVTTNQQKDCEKPISRQEQIMNSYKEVVKANGDALKRLSQN